MTPAQLSAIARQAVSRRKWGRVLDCANRILNQDSAASEGHFLKGLVAKASGDGDAAVAAFRHAYDADPGRYDAAVELANQYAILRRNADAAAALAEVTEQLENSPLYLNLAGRVLTQVGMPERAWPLFERANALQPGVEVIESNLANCAVILGKVDEAKQLYRSLLRRFPAHQNHHYKLSRLETAADSKHIEQMESVLSSGNLPPRQNVFLYYALGKEYEDLERWERAFRYFKMAGDAVASVADYDIDADIELVDTIIDTCSADWLASHPAESPAGVRTPIFVVGLPRSGTTLTDRILASHSKVQSVGESQYMQMVIRRESGVISDRKMSPEMIVAGAKLDIADIGSGYLDALEYRLGDEPMFVDKLPFNVLYLGFIAKAFPEARIVMLHRHPMDVCFAMYKQVFTWAYKFSYRLEDLGRFYVAYRRLVEHWQQVLGSRIYHLSYENLVSDQESQTRSLLAGLGLEFEPECLEFHRNRSATATASTVQVREKIHTRSVDRWRCYERQLAPLREYLERAGVPLE